MRIGGNLEMALYLAQVTGSFIYTDVHHRWLEIQSSVLRKPGDEDLDPWAPLRQALDSVHFTMYLDPDPRLWFHIKEKGTFEEFISLYRRICSSVRNIQDPDEASAEAKELAYLVKEVDMKAIFDSADKEFEKLKEGINEQFMQHKVKIPVNHITPVKGLSSNSVSQILLTHGFNTPYWNSVPFGAFIDLYSVASVNYPMQNRILNDRRNRSHNKKKQ
jgi:hypothetical protein